VGKKAIAVVGGGISGLAAASELAKPGSFRVVLFEKEARLGGLSGYHEWRDISFDRFYHVILSTDRHLLAYIREVGLDSGLFWRTTRTGFFAQSRLTSLSSVTDYLKFPFLKPMEKLRLGAGILFAAHLVKSGQLDGLTAPEWLEKTFGREVFLKIWNPLLRSKLGEAAGSAPAAFIQATIKRLYGARSVWKKRELMGHVRGGYRGFIAAAEKQLSEKDVSVCKSSPVVEIGLDADGESLYLRTAASRQRFDKILLAVPPPQAARMVRMPESSSQLHSLERIDYLGIICVLLVLRRRLSPYYVINLLDSDLPFTGVIESTNVIPPEEVGGKHLVYLPKYMSSGNPLYNRPDEEIIELFLEKFRKIFPDLREDDILHCQVSRGKYAQPLGFAERSASSRYFLKIGDHIYLPKKSSESYWVPNNNSAVFSAQETAQKILAELSASNRKDGY
jgi:protoporphyrinogen oxidase